MFSLVHSKDLSENVIQILLLLQAQLSYQIVFIAKKQTKSTHAV